MILSLILVGVIGYTVMRYLQTRDPQLLAYAGVCFLILMIMEIFKRSRQVPPVAERSGLAARLFAGISAFRAGDIEHARTCFVGALEQAAGLSPDGGPLVQVLQLLPALMEGETVDVQAYHLAGSTVRVSDSLQQSTHVELQHLGVALNILLALIEYCKERGQTDREVQLTEQYNRLYAELCAMRRPSDPVPEQLGIRRL